MVIQQFNRLIKNKWVWGVFALTISALFLIPDDWVGRGRGYSDPDSAGRLGEKDVNIALFNGVKQDVSGIGRYRADDRTFAQVNQETWQNLAALKTAKDLGLEASDEAVRENIRQTREFCGPDGGFKNAQYVQVLQRNGLTPEYYQAYLKRAMTLGRLRLALFNCAGWLAPVELESEVNDMTDAFTVRLVSFYDKNADKVTVDDKAVEAYYRENTNAVALPACMVVRYARVAADDPKRLATFKIPLEEMQDNYDASLSEFKTTGTNGVAVTKPFEEVKGLIERRLQLAASIEAYQHDLIFRVSPEDDGKDAKKDGLDKLAAAEKLKIVTTRPFAVDGRGFVKGLMVNGSEIAPDCPGFVDEASKLNPDPSECYGVAVGTNCVYVIECVKLDEPRVPAFAEVKDIMRPDALAEARAKAFKAEVAKSRALAAAELAKGKPFDPKMFGDANVSTSIVFSASNRQAMQASDLMYAAEAIVKLDKGNISDFIPMPNPRRGLVVYVEKREPGKDPAQRRSWRVNMGGRLKFAELRTLSPAWQKWNLNRIGFTPTSRTQVTEADEALSQED